MGGLYPAASKFWAHCMVKPASAKKLCYLFLLVYPGNAGFPKTGTYSVLNIVRKIKAGFNLLFTRCVLCQAMCQFCVASFVYGKEYLS